MAERGRKGLRLKTCEATQCDRNFPTFWKDLLPAFSGFSRFIDVLPVFAEWMQSGRDLNGAINSQLNWAILLWRHTRRKNWVNCAVFTGNSAGLRSVLPSRLSHKELRISPKESHSYLSLPADTTIAQSQGTFVSSNSFGRWTSHDFRGPREIMCGQ